MKLFPYVMYLARPVRDDSPTWSPGYYEPAVGHYVKYKNEFRAASAYATIIRSRADWENGAWRQFDPESIVHPPLSLPRRLRYACERAYYEWSQRILSALRRPGRVGRFARFFKRTLLEPPPPPIRLEVWLLGLRRTAMPRKRHKPEEIVAKLRQVDVLARPERNRCDPLDRRERSDVLPLAPGDGGLKSDQVKRLKDLETENGRLRRAISDLTLDKLILQGLPRETSSPARRRAASSMCNVSFTYPSAGPMRRSASIARRNVRCREALKTTSG